MLFIDPFRVIHWERLNLIWIWDVGYVQLRAKWVALLFLRRRHWVLLLLPMIPCVEHRPQGIILHQTVQGGSVIGVPLYKLTGHSYHIWVEEHEDPVTSNSRIIHVKHSQLARLHLSISLLLACLMFGRWPCLRESFQIMVVYGSHRACWFCTFTKLCLCLTTMKEGKILIALMVMDCNVVNL